MASRYVDRQSVVAIYAQDSCLPKETTTSTLEVFGDPEGYSAMAYTVGMTCGVATQLLLDGHRAFNQPGVLAPYYKEICEPIRNEVEAEGIKFVDKVI